MVEKSLTRALIAALDDVTQMDDLFHDKGAPLSTFSNKIIMGRALRLFGENDQSDLDAIRSIRNQFAHAMLPLTFDDAYIVERVNVMRDYPRKGIENDDRGISPNRTKYEVVCYLMTGRLMKAAIRKHEARQSTLESQGALASLNHLISAGLKGFPDDVLSNKALNVSLSE
ncbi:MAG: hypothetical protein EOP84_32230 [Verrucomicrobiaceae bacterium]|nr:MAG: hypothetical protein EOP84_32230 [Verrucomicrobiaceae bacterium]